jgi:hypothetical protein
LILRRWFSFLALGLLLLQGLASQGLTLCIKAHHEIEIELDCDGHCQPNKAQPEFRSDATNHPSFQSKAACLDIELQLDDCLIRRWASQLNFKVWPSSQPFALSLVRVVHGQHPNLMITPIIHKFQAPRPSIHHSIKTAVLLI